MKNVLCIFLIIFVSGCTQPSKIIKKHQNIKYKNNVCIIDEQVAPSWICGKNINYPLYITSVGLSSASNKKGAASIFGIEKLFTKIKKDINIRTKEYFLMLGLSPDDYKRIPNQLSYYLSKNVLTKTSILDSWTRKKTNVKYVLVGIKKDKIAKGAFDFLVSDIKNKKTIKAFSIAFDSYFEKKITPSF